MVIYELPTGFFISQEFQEIILKTDSFWFQVLVLVFRKIQLNSTQIARPELGGAWMGMAPFSGALLGMLESIAGRTPRYSKVHLGCLIKYILLEILYPPTMINLMMLLIKLTDTFQCPKMICSVQLNYCEAGFFKHRDQLQVDAHWRSPKRPIEAVPWHGNINGDVICALESQTMKFFVLLCIAGQPQPPTSIF